MDPDMSLGQLYKMQNEIKILYKAKVGPTHFLRHKRQLNKPKMTKQYVKKASSWKNVKLAK